IEGGISLALLLYVSTQMPSSAISILGELRCSIGRDPNLYPAMRAEPVNGFSWRPHAASSI
ncbi:MAG TPA: hypothetical protein VJ572_06960, partial [Azonexus sp.]|nr:hypothetical protein [Azonexus sp.]